MTFWDTIIMSGAIHGFVLTAIILLKRDRTLSSNLLASLLLVQGLACLITASFIFRDQSPFFSWIDSVDPYFPFFLTFAVGPLIYLHTRSVLKPKDLLTRKDLAHFLALSINLIPPFLNIGAWIFPASFWIPDEWRIRVNNLLLSEGDYLAWLHIASYIVLSIRLLQRCQTNSPIQKPYQKWLRNFLYGFLTFQMIWLPVELIYLTPYSSIFSDYGLYYYPIYIPLVALIYWIGIKWLMLTSKNRHPSEQKPVIPFSPDKLELHMQQLTSLMSEQHLYRDPDLKLADLSLRLNVPAHVLSFLLNNHLSTNFNKFVNEYRIEEAIARMRSNDMKEKTLEGISMEVGFRSRSSFYRSFKEITGKHPRGYLKPTD